MVDATSRIDYQVGAAPATEELKALYSAVGWSGYTDHPEKLAAILPGSSWFMTARCRHLPTDDAAICRRPSGASLSVATGSGASVSVPTRSGASLSVPTRSGASPSVPTRSGTSHHPGRLVGLVRVVSDGCSVALVQDLLVAPAFQRCGIGRRLLDEAMTRFADLRQVLLITDDEPATRDFYRACGLSTLAETHGLGFIRYNLSA